MVCNWLSRTVEDELVAHDRLGFAVGRCMGILYMHYGLVGSQDPEWIQGSLNVLNVLFQRYRLVASVIKSKAMMCQPGDIWSGMPEEAVG